MSEKKAIKVMFFYNNKISMNGIIFIVFSAIFSSNTVICQDTLYNNNYSIACHNCFEKKYSQTLGEALSYTSTIEIDIWDMPILLNWSGAIKGDWYVKHTFLQKGNQNCFGGSLANCLTEIANWSSINTNHKVLTIFIDKKQGWSSKNGTRSPQDLDKLILSIFNRKQILAPQDLRQNEPDLRTALKKHSWLSLNKLKGKVIFIITDATFFRLRNRVLNKYLDKTKQSAICFVAPTIKNRTEISKPKGVSINNASNIIFFNLNFKNCSLSEQISSNNYINRVFRSPETTSEINNLTKRKVNFIALFNYKLRRNLNGNK
jgi:hypothetical protein